MRAIALRGMAVVVLAAAVVHCSSFASKDDPVAPDDSGAPIDGATPPPPPSATDAGTVLGFCASTDAAYCESFDEPSFPPSGATRSASAGPPNTSSAERRDGGHSPPYAFVSAVQVTDPDANRQVTTTALYDAKPIPVTGKIHFHAWILFKALSTTIDDAELSLLDFSAKGGPTQQLYVQFSGNGDMNLQYGLQGSATSHSACGAIQTPIPQDGFDVDIVLVPETSTITVTMGGYACTDTVLPDVGAGAPTGPFTVMPHLGFDFVRASTVEGWIDDVTIAFE